MDVAIDLPSEGAGQVLKDATGGLGVDVAIETSAVYQALEQAIRGFAFNGTTAVAHFNIPNLIFARANNDPNLDHPRWDFARIRHPG